MTKRHRFDGLLCIPGIRINAKKRTGVLPPKASTERPDPKVVRRSPG